MKGLMTWITVVFWKTQRSSHILDAHVFTGWVDGGGPGNAHCWIDSGSQLNAIAGPNGKEDSPSGLK